MEDRGSDNMVTYEQIMSRRPLYIFDLDGTLALMEHRLPFINNGEKRWREFYEACDQDQPNTPVITLLNNLRQARAEIRIFTGRSDIVRLKTAGWLFAHTSLSYTEIEHGLIMRKDGDYRQDHELKQSWLQQMPAEDYSRIQMVFEDRDRVVQMWRENGLVCLQVATGAY